MALTDKAAVVVSLRVLVTVLVTVFVFLLSKVGGVLNRCRGGYLDFDKILPGNDSDAGVYWARHVLSRAVFALPTALLVVSSVDLARLTEREASAVWRSITWSPAEHSVMLVRGSCKVSIL